MYPPAKVKATELPCRQPGINPDDWFADPRGPRAAAAIDLCTTCPLMVQCGRAALEDGVPEGIWGGLTPRDRQAVWAVTGGKPTTFLDIIDQAVRPLLQNRRDHESGSAASVFDFRKDPVKS